MSRVRPDLLRRALLVSFSVAILSANTFGASKEEVVLAAPVRVATSSDAEIFPELWRKKPIAASGEAIPTEQYPRACELLTRAFGKYPTSVLEKNLTGVYVLSKLRFSGIGAGGTNSRSVVFLTMGEPKLGYTDALVEVNFHAEFSSILLRNHRADFDAEAWKMVNPKDFQYLGSGVEAVRKGRVGRQSDDDLHELGFLSVYGQASIEEDFNTFAIVLFAGDAVRWERVDAQRKLKAKMTLALDLYRKVSPEFTEKRFRAFAAKK